MLGSSSSSVDGGHGPPQQQGVVKGIRVGRNTLGTLHDLELALNAAVHVNQHLNDQIEAAVQQLARAEQERHAWEQHARRLASQLAGYKRREAAAAAAGDGDVGAAAGEQQLAEQLAQPPAAASQQEQEQQQQQAGLPPELQDSISQLVQQGQAAGWLARASEVELADTVGQGAFGTTFRAVWRGAHVAVKCVAVSSDSELLNFLREVQCLAALRHPHVVPFLGAVLQEEGKCWLISEFMDRGTLAAWLHNNKGPLGPAQPLSVRVGKALEVCRGLAALEACRPPLLHRDVKPSNVFLDASGAARLGDFGLARPLPANRACLTGETGTYLYMSPEIIRHEVYDGKTDVWSFGVLLAELVTGQVPYQHTFMTPVQIAMAVADEKLAPLLPTDAGLPAGLVAAAALCCDFDPEMRPSFATLVPELEEAVAELQAAEAASNSFLGRFMSNSLIPSTWSSVLGQLGSDAAAQVQQQQAQQQQASAQ